MMGHQLAINTRGHIVFVGPWKCLTPLLLILCSCNSADSPSLNHLNVMVEQSKEVSSFEGIQHSNTPAGARSKKIHELLSLSARRQHVAIENTANNYFFPGLWFSKEVHFSDQVLTTNGPLKLALGDSLATVNRAMSPGLFPLISAASDFYVEVEAKLSSDDADHWPAIWMLPVEHNGTQPRSIQSDPLRYERYMELDIDEGGFGPGITGTAISWEGIWPNFKKQQNPNNVSKISLIRTEWHRFGVSYNACNLEVTWWMDDKLQHSAGQPYVPAVARLHNYYLILSAQSHGKQVPYTMEVRRIRVFR